MARAALAVVFSQERDEEIAALRARMVEMQRRHEIELLEVRWQERLEFARAVYRSQRDDDTGDDTDDGDERIVMRCLVPLIEQSRWGIVPSADSSGQFNFQRPGRVETILVTVLCIVVSWRGPMSISQIMANTEGAAGLPPGSIIRLPP